ncbi:MAG: LysR substrate-binding domain-containing protein, partial [Pseudomonadota bacterium]
AMKPVFEVADHLHAGRLVPVAVETPPVSVQMACLYTHRRHQDPKARLFMDFMIEGIAKVVRGADSAS